MYVWLVLTDESPFSVSTTGLHALCAIWIGALLPIVSPRSTAREEAAARRTAARMNPGAEGNMHARVGSIKKACPASALAMDRC